MDRADRLLAALWLIWGALLILIFVFYSQGLPLFGADTRAAWEWLIPNLFPPMALVAGLSYQQAKKPGDPPPPTVTAAKGSVSNPWIVVPVSLFYLLLLSISVLGCLTSDTPLETLRQSNLWLGPILAIATALLGTRFAR